MVTGRGFLSRPDLSNVAWRFECATPWTWSEHFATVLASTNNVNDCYSKPAQWVHQSLRGCGVRPQGPAYSALKSQAFGDTEPCSASSAEGSRSLSQHPPQARLVHFQRPAHRRRPLGQAHPSSQHLSRLRGPPPRSVLSTSYNTTSYYPGMHYRSSLIYNMLKRKQVTV